MVEFVIWLLISIPDDWFIPNTQVLIDITPELIQSFLAHVKQTKGQCTSDMIKDLNFILAKKQIVYFFPPNFSPGTGNEVISFVKIPGVPLRSFCPISLLPPTLEPGRSGQVELHSVLDLPKFLKEEKYLKFLFNGNYFIWGISGFVISEIVLLDLLYTERMRLLASNPELPPLGINVSDYITGNGPFFANKETEEMALKLLVSLGKSLTVGLAAGCLSYGLYFLAS
jgi:hypothetical protein